MASIEYGIDRKGKKIYAREAISGRYYMCPYCYEQIHVRKKGTSNREDYFAHNKQSDRTPEKRICPGYTGDSYNKKIENINDKIYISNGGLPLYLLKIQEGRYKLEARFPPLSYKTSKLLKEWDLSVIIKEGDYKPVKYSAVNIRPYPVKSAVKWIEVKFDNKLCDIDELNEKWGWGIRGISLDSDFFHSNNYGGFRLSQHSNVILGKEYLYISEWKLLPNVEGVIFDRKGKIILSEKEYNINSIIVNQITDESIGFIQMKGYQLIEENDEIIPIWPPAVIEGKEIIYQYNDEEAYLYKNYVSNQEVYSVTKNGLVDVNINNQILKTYTLDNTILLSDYNFNLLSNEISYMLTRERKNFLEKEIMKAEATYKTFHSDRKDFKDFSIDLFKNKELYFESNLPMEIIVGKDNYIDYSSKQFIEGSKTYNKISLNLFAFGVIGHRIKKECKSSINVGELDFLAKKLYRCKSPVISFRKDYLKILDYMKTKHEGIYKILLQWSIRGKIPYIACKYLDNITREIDDERR